MSESGIDAAQSRPRLRAEIDTPIVTAVAGQPVTLTLQVVNTGTVIEMIDVRLVGLLADRVERSPADITLFPDEQVEVTLALTFHRSLPSGSHEGLLIVSGRSDTTESTELEILIEVPEEPAVTVVIEPPMRRGRRRVTYDVLVEDTGNTPVELMLQASDTDRVLDLTLTQRKLELRPDQSGFSVLGLRAPRKWTGPPEEHVLTVTAAGDEVSASAEARFLQRALLTPGVITILTLLFIVLLWTLAMLFGVQAAFSPPDPVKVAPTTFTEGLGSQDLDPALVAGGILGSVLAESTDQAVERVTVEVFDARGELVTATASGDDGGFEVAGLLPARYRLRFRATGYEERWWPAAPDASGAVEVSVRADDEADAGVTRLAGLAGAMGGEVLAGDGDPVTSSVQLQAIDLVDEAAPVTATTDGSGFWSVDGLIAPATYRITYSAPGYVDVELTQELEAGEQLALSVTRLPAAPGAISGVVQDRDGTPLGGVEVLAQRGDTELSTTTPTSGEVGSFAFDELETPGTYLLTFIAEGYASETQGVRLDPGGSVDGLVVELADATGTVSGQATSSTGQALGGVAITVTGGEITATTDTLTSGNVGSYRRGGLPLPGTYTVTFDLEGYGRESVQVVLSRDDPAAVASAVLTPNVGRLTGQVVDRDTGDPLAGASVEISDGSTTRSTTTASAPSAQVGRFNVGDLAPGTYTVTVSVPGGGTTTVLESVTPASTRDVTIRVAGP